MSKLELRMYGFVPYSLSGIQKGIQYGHAVDQYARKFVNDENYIHWVDNCRTSIILNGGTTNNCITSRWYGSMNKIVDSLRYVEVKHTVFHEPDLGDQLTGIAFLVDERVFNNIDYPTFDQYMKDRLDTIDYLEYFKNGKEQQEKAKNDFHEDYTEWVNLIGGVGNVFLKEFLPTFKLA